MALLSFPAKKGEYDIEKERSNNSVGKRIKELRMDHNLQQKELAKLLREQGVDVSTGAVGKWEVGASVPNAYQLCVLCSIFDHNILSDFISTKEHSELDDLNDIGKQKVHDYILDLVATNLYPAHRTRVDKKICMKALRVYDFPASAGTGSFIEGADFEEVRLPQTDIPEDTDFGIRIYGNSMEPRYENGQIAMVHQQSELLPGEFGIFIVDGDAYIKQYTETEPDEDELEEYTAHDGTVYPKIILVSLNPEYKNITVKPSQRLTVIGKVLN